jgi:hypothetical protein
MRAGPLVAPSISTDGNCRLAGITVNYAVTGGTATGSGTDHTLASGQLTFNPGVTS